MVEEEVNRGRKKRMKRRIKVGRLRKAKVTTAGAGLCCIMEQKLPLREEAKKRQGLLPQSDPSSLTARQTSPACRPVEMEGKAA